VILPLRSTGRIGAPFFCLAERPRKGPFDSFLKMLDSAVHQIIPMTGPKSACTERVSGAVVIEMEGISNDTYAKDHSGQDPQAFEDLSSHTYPT